MQNIKKILVLCGDSFNYGIGCVNLHTQPYGVLTAKHFDWDLIRLARGSASNYVIHLQAKYALRMNPKPHLVIIGTTSTDRVEWLATGTKLKDFIPPKFEDVNYHLYPPHHEPQPCHDAPMDFYLKDNPNYDPKILSEQVVAFSEYLNLLKKGNDRNYYKRLFTESAEKIELIERYYFDIFDSGIKYDYDVGVIFTAYAMLKKAGINTVIFGSDTTFENLVYEKRDYYYQDWGRCTKLWPDTVNSMHTSEEGHADTASRLINHIEQNNFL